MGIVQKTAVRITVLSYVGLIIGYFNKVFFFLAFLETDEIGLINLVIAVGLLFGQLANLGAVNAIWKFLPFFRSERSTEKGFFTLMLLTCLIGFLLVSALSLVFHSSISNYYSEKSPEFIHYFPWVILVGFAWLFFLAFDSYLRSIYKNSISVVSNELVVRLLTTIALLFYGFDLIGFEYLVIICCLIYVVPMLILVFYTYRLKEFQFKLQPILISRRFRKIIFVYGSFNYLNTIGAAMVITIDSIMVAGMLGLKATGIYTMIIYLTSALQIPYRSLSRISVPMVANYWKTKDLINLQNLYKKVSSVSLTIGVFLFLLIWINRDAIFKFLPPEFEIGKYVFLFLMIGRIFDMYFGLNGAILTSSKKYKFDIYFTILLLALVWSLNHVLIPTYQVVGAAISTGIALILYNLSRTIYIYRQYGLNPFNRDQFKILFLTLLNGIAFYFIPVPELNKYLSIILFSGILSLTFLLPIYILKLEPNIVGYMDQIILRLKRKFQ